MRRSTGFTLLEILIALAIFAVIALITAIGLRSVLHTNEHLQKTDERIRQVITAVTIMRRDFSDIILRGVRDTSGSGLPAFQLISRTNLQFTHTGFSNPMMIEKRSTLQRVAYQFNQHAIYRITWPVLDRAPNTKSSRKVLLDHVRDLTFSFVNQKGEVVDTLTTQGLPKAVLVTITLDKLGQIPLVFPIRGQGNGNVL